MSCRFMRASVLAVLAAFIIIAANVQAGRAQGGPPGGRSEAIAFTATGSTVYVATSTNGVFKRIDAGANWVPVNSGLTSLQIRALAIDPSNPNIVYAGSCFYGVFKTTDAGTSWNAVNSSLINTSVSSLAVNPSNPSGSLLQAVCYPLCCCHEREWYSCEWRDGYLCGRVW